MLSRCWLGLLLIILALPQISQGDDRVALVIGNAKYEGNPLRNPVNDAAAIEACLKALNFKVTMKTDVNLKEMEAAVVGFNKSLTKESIGLFFYAGHGVEVKGENFLMPLGAELTAEFQVKEKCYKLDQVLSALEDSNAALKIVILDCCRDNPFIRSWRRGDKGKGLAAVATLPEGTIIAFSTAPGQTALDSSLGARNNSPYTKHLVASLGKRPAEGLELITALRMASQEVKLDTNQTPWIKVDSSISNYYLVAASGKPGIPMIPTPGKPTIPDSPQPPVDPLSGAKSITNSIGMKLLLIATGKFTMGSPASEEGGGTDEEQVEVTLSKSYFLGQTEVTQGQWKTVMGTEPWKGKEYVKEGANYPATYVSWDDAQEFCKKLSVKEGKTYRLPTEAEWEYACRGGTTTAYSFGKDATNLGDYGWWGGIFGNGNAKTEQYAHQVGLKKENSYGLYDMHGNVYEWCEDIYVAKLAGGRDPVVSAGGSTRVGRGGCWPVGATGCRSTTRAGCISWLRNSSLGFRVALSSSK